jgi:hypothetical protein
MMKRTWLFGGIAAIALAGAAVLVMAAGASAQEGDAGSGRTPLLQRVADKLGIDVATLRGAVKDSALEMVDEALADGRITEQQAERARERIEAGKPLHLTPRERAQLWARHAIVESAAGALGITPDELRGELRSGKSIADVADERGVSLDDVKTPITSDMQAKLDQAVANNRITQQQADDAMTKLNDRLDGHRPPRPRRRSGGGIDHKHQPSHKRGWRGHHPRHPNSKRKDLCASVVPSHPLSTQDSKLRTTK